MSFSLRAACPEDADFVLDLFALPHVRAFTHGPHSHDAFRERVRGCQASDDRVMLIVERDGCPFGNVNFDVHDGWLLEVRVIAFAQQRTGAGRFALTHVLAEAFAVRRAHRVYLEVVERNLAARALYEKLGFCCEGVFRDGYRAADGTFENLVPYARLAEATTAALSRR